MLMRRSRIGSRSRRSISSIGGKKCRVCNIRREGWFEVTMVRLWVMMLVGHDFLSCQLTFNNVIFNKRWKNETEN